MFQGVLKIVDFYFRLSLVDFICLSDLRKPRVISGPILFVVMIYSKKA